MACAGLSFFEDKLDPEFRKKEPIDRILDLALEMMEYSNSILIGGMERIKIKIGIHFGPCIFGLIGYHKPQFSLIGDTINTTSRHCTTGPERCIIISDRAKNLVSDKTINFDLIMADMKGKGLVRTFVLNIDEVEKIRTLRKENKRTDSIIHSDVIFNKNLGFGF